MLDIVFALIAIAVGPAMPDVNANAGAGQVTAPVAVVKAPSTVIIGSGVKIGNGVVIEGLPAVPDLSNFVAEAQTPSGKFTTAAEVKPILQATKANWIAVREYGGSDLVYLTHLWAWRCGLVQIAVAVNDGALEVQPLPECHMKYATPNAILEEDGLPYLTYGQGSVQRLTVQVVYDDLTHETAVFERSQVLIP